MRNKNAWRWELDPRDPDYDDPPSAEDMDDEPANYPEDSFDDDDPRGDGPYHYIPPGDH